MKLSLPWTTDLTISYNTVILLVVTIAGLTLSQITSMLHCSLWITMPLVLVGGVSGIVMMVRG